MLMTSIFPGRYVQGAGALALLPEEAARLGTKALAVVSGAARPVVERALAGQALVEFTLEPFGGECSDEEIERLVARTKQVQADVVIGIGGGKTLDTVKAVGHFLKLPVVVVPSIASTDAPCSALSVIYTPEGAFSRYLVLPRNPDVVLVDSEMVANAPVRFLVSGMGDALSTWFEADDCRVSQASNMTGRAGSMTAFGLARLCFDTLMADGIAAKNACESKTVTPALERVIEANTLLSGLGFESGGLSGAHAIHNGLTLLPETHKCWHGEKVAMGTLALLQLTRRTGEMISVVYDFCQAVGLPICLADIGLANPTDEQLMAVARQACAPGETIHNIKGGVTPEDVFAAIKAADAEGRRRKG
ncbi:MAG: glycerol dehydrogenase [Humidesulfovibrio sp.]|uniref:glycerol dehydrogenase n=1 Tax=Humidesulfovibrio sp. TaxID=2910988 RepID=UPI002732C835|nr:glycerol dehydrogenase [Humidesulfovibrio sp.]MDP2846850.1 glycerol dehydrogenase [Humidesulfovibrio sp.]